MILLRAANRTGRVWLVPRGLHGVIPANFAAGGDPSPLENDADLPGDAATQFLWWLRTPLLDATSNGTTTVTDAGAYTHTGADDGTWQQGYAWRALLADGSIESSVDLDAVIEFTIGAGSITLVGAACAQAATSSTGAITQVHQLAADDSAQAAACTTGAISLGDAINLVAASADQAAACTTGAISQVHVLQAAACAQAAVSAAATISQIHILVAANSSAGAGSSTGAIVLGDLPADVWPLQRRRARASNVSAARRAPQLSTATRSNIQ